MEEETKVVLEKEERAEEPQQQQEGGMTPNCKNALIAFILAVVGFGIGWVYGVGCIAGIVLGIISLSFLKKIDGEVEKQPFRTFSKVAKPVAIVTIVWSAIWLVVPTILFVVTIVLLASLILLFLFPMVKI